jgi:hypothetical protein
MQNTFLYITKLNLDLIVGVDNVDLLIEVKQEEEIIEV